MNIPKSFSEMAASVHQDFQISDFTREQLIDYIYGGFSPQEQEGLVEFLRQITTELSDVELLRLWNSSASDLLFDRPSELRKFVQFIGALSGPPISP